MFSDDIKRIVLNRNLLYHHEVIIVQGSLKDFIVTLGNTEESEVCVEQTARMVLEYDKPRNQRHFMCLERNAGRVEYYYSMMM